MTIALCRYGLFASLAVGWLTAIAAAAGAPSIKLMFGAPTRDAARAKFLDFAYVTSAARLDDGQPWGWTKSNKITDWLYANDRLCSIPLDGLLDHSVTCWDGTLSIRVPRGPVAVHLWIGDMIQGIRRTQASFRVAAEGKTVSDERITFNTVCTERWWLRGESEVYRKNTDRWTRQVRPMLDEYDFTADVQDGVLDLKMENVNLTAMVIVPGADSAAMKAILAEIEQERRRQFDERYPGQPQPDEAMPPVDESSRRRGFVVFQKLIDEQVCPWSRPKADEVSDEVRVFAARGEQEAFRFGVLPLRDLRQFAVKVGDFTGPKGAKIETARCGDFWTERYTERGSGSTTARKPSLDPACDVLLDRGPTDYEPGMPRMFLLDLRVPKDAVPGMYRAPATFLEDGRESGRAELLLRVLPWELEAAPVPYSFQATYVHWSDLLREDRDEAAARRALESRVRFIGKYGFSASYFAPKWGWASVKGEPGERRLTFSPRQEQELDWWYRLVMNEGNARQWIQFHWPGSFWGLPGWNPPIHFRWDGTGALSDVERRDLVRCIRQFEDLCRRKGYPKHYWYGSGEPDNFGEAGVQRGNEFADLVHEAGGSTLCSLNGPIGAKLAPAHHDIVLANHATPITEQFIARVKGLGHQFGSHNTGDSRLAAGYQFWRLGGVTKFQEVTLYAAYTVPYTYLPWNYKAAAVYPTRDLGWRPTVRWLRYRDGRDDFLYLYNLAQRLRKAKAAGLGQSPAAKEAAALIAELRDKIYLDPSKYFGEAIDSHETGSGVAVGWTPKRFARYRWMIAALMMKLDGSNRN